MTLLSFLTCLELKNSYRKKFIREFKEPVPKRIINLICHRVMLKKQLIDALELKITNSIPKFLLNFDKSVKI